MKLNSYTLRTLGTQAAGRGKICHYTDDCTIVLIFLESNNYTEESQRPVRLSQGENIQRG